MTDGPFRSWLPGHGNLPVNSALAALWQVLTPCTGRRYLWRRSYAGREQAAVCRRDARSTRWASAECRLVNVLTPAFGDSKPTLNLGKRLINISSSKGGVKLSCERIAL